MDEQGHGVEVQSDSIFFIWDTLSPCEDLTSIYGMKKTTHPSS